MQQKMAAFVLVLFHLPNAFKTGFKNSFNDAR